MAVEYLQSAQIFLGNYDVSGKHNQVKVDYSAAMLDVTVFGMTNKANLPGLFDWHVSGSGFFDIGLPAPAYGDQTFFNQIGATELPLTVCPKNADLGVAFIIKAIQPSLQWLGAVGEVAPLSLDHAPTSYGCRGVLGLQAIQKVAAGNGTGFQFSAPLSATQRLVAAMHVIQFNGTTMTMLIESDDNGGFASAVTRITFTAATAITSEWKELVGPVATDDRYRCRWTFTGTSFTALVAFGIANYVV